MNKSHKLPLNSINRKYGSLGKLAPSDIQIAQPTL